MHYVFKQEEISEIVNSFGTAFYEKVREATGFYAEKWALTDFRLIPSYSANLVFMCRSERFGSVVLKIGNPVNGGIYAEWSTLRHYNGRRFCRVLEADIAGHALLEEAVQPGTCLREERSLGERLSVFCSLYQGLHLPPDQAMNVPTYRGWVNRIAEYMHRRHTGDPLSLHMQKANEICSRVSATYSREMLLHGDFHHDNILLGPGGAYRIIDPKGVIGDPVFDVPRFILNEFDDDITPGMEQKINEIIRIFESNLRIPGDIIKKCLYIETAMGMCWCVESGASPAEYPGLLRKVAFAEAIMEA